jgi:hypothetical protein
LATALARNGHSVDIIRWKHQIQIPELQDKGNITERILSIRNDNCSTSRWLTAENEAAFVVIISHFNPQSQYPFLLFIVKRRSYAGRRG